MKKDQWIKGVVIGLNLLLLVIKISSCTGSDNLSKQPTDFSVQASSLFTEFSSNEADANQKYVGKVLEVLGTIKKMSTSKSGSMSLLLETNNDGAIQCNFLVKDIPELSSVAAGKTIKIKGRCSGFLLDVQLDDCLLL